MNINQLSYKHEKNGSYFFKNLKLALEANKLHALHGKNGAGKSILLNLLDGKKTPQSVVEGQIESFGKTRLVNQRFDQLIVDKFTFNQNLQFACMKSYPSMLSRLKAPLVHFDFIQNLHIDQTVPVSQLSGGQRQILALLMVLQKPIQILLLDEPTATLDEDNAKLVFDFLKLLTRQGVTILVVCHDKELVSGYVTGTHFCIEKEEGGLRIIRLMTLGVVSK